MKVSEAQVKKVLSGDVQYKFNQLALNLLFTRLTGVYKKNPTSIVLKTSTDEVNAFFAKFAAIMKSDYELISRL